MHSGNGSFSDGAPWLSPHAGGIGKTQSWYRHPHVRRRLQQSPECLRDDGGFSHNQFALTLVRELEHPYPRFAGLNLTREVLEAQIGRANKQSRERTPLLEAQVVDIADSITYDAHDVDDAVKLELLTIEQLKDIPLVADCLRRIDDRIGPLSGKILRRALVHELIDYQVGNVISTSVKAIDAQRIESAKQARETTLELDSFDEKVARYNR